MKTNPMTLALAASVLALSVFVRRPRAPAPSPAAAPTDATEPVAEPREAATDAPSLESSVPAGRTITAIRYLRANDSPHGAVEAANVLLSGEENVECMYAVRVDRAWVTHVREYPAEPYPLQQCMNARRIHGRWVFLHDEIGGYETTSGDNVDTSWFEAWSVVDGAFARVYPTREYLFRKLPAGELLAEEDIYHFNGERIGLAWADDGRTLVDLLEARLTPESSRHRVTKRER